MLEVPAATPVTTPVDDIVAIDGVPLIQVPPGVVLLNVVVLPSHTLAVPVMGGRAALETTANRSNTITASIFRAARDSNDMVNFISSVYSFVTYKAH
jgi:hypothetical protein